MFEHRDVAGVLVQFCRDFLIGPLRVENQFDNLHIVKFEVFAHAVEQGAQGGGQCVCGGVGAVSSRRTYQTGGMVGGGEILR